MMLCSSNTNVKPSSAVEFPWIKMQFSVWILCIGNHHIPAHWNTFQKYGDLYIRLDVQMKWNRIWYTHED